MSASDSLRSVGVWAFEFVIFLLIVHTTHMHSHSKQPPTMPPPTTAMRHSHYQAWPTPDVSVASNDAYGIWRQQPADRGRPPQVHPAICPVHLIHTHHPPILCGWMTISLEGKENTPTLQAHPCSATGRFFREGCHGLLSVFCCLCKAKQGLDAQCATHPTVLGIVGLRACRMRVCHTHGAPLILANTEFDQFRIEGWEHNPQTVIHKFAQIQLDNTRLAHPLQPIITDNQGELFHGAETDKN